ncbi:MAG: protein-export rane protein SecF [Actinomycetia bacterium]|nr:protein-export rane protein SecF [Actinomycetes bacterium]
MSSSTDEMDIPGVTRRHRVADFYHERTNFQFIKHSRRWLYISATLMLISVVALGVRGLSLGIEFKGGTSWQVPVTGKSPSVPDVRNVLAPLHVGDAKVSILSGQGKKSVRAEARVLNDPVQDFQTELATYAKVGAADVVLERTTTGAGGTFTLTSKNKAISQAGIEAIAKKHTITGAKVNITGTAVTITVAKLPPSPVDAVTVALAKYANAPVRDVSVSTVGPTWGSDVSHKAVKALIIFFILLAIYLAVRFEWKMSAAAIIAVIHDILFTVGFYALFHFPVSPATVTAFLTILGFSLYDTVVVFDKVRENQSTITSVGRSTYSDMVNRSLNQVLMRSLSTSFVALLPVISMLVIGVWVLGATTLEDFALALLVGLFIGSYSSIFVAAPILAWWKEKEPQYRALRERHRRAAGPVLAVAAEEVGVPVGAGVRSGAGPGSMPSSVPRPVTPRPRQQRRRKRR